MKAIEILKEMSGYSVIYEVHKGCEFLHTKYKLEVLSGEIHGRKTYVCSFRDISTSHNADVILCLGGGGKQYLYEIN